MTYKEFKKWAESEGLRVEHWEHVISLVDGGMYIGTVSKKRQFVLSTDYSDFGYRNKTEEERILSKLVELAMTPLEKREEVKRYRLKHRYLCNYGSDEYVYLTVCDHELRLSLDRGIEFRSTKTIFTGEEIEELKRKYRTDLLDFEMIEVENEF